MKILRLTKRFRGGAAIASATAFVLTALLLQTTNAIAQINSVQNQTAAKNYEFINGNWFDGKRFRRRVFYSVSGFLSDKKPFRIDERVDLRNGFVIPPFADAHTHNLDGSRGLEKMIEAYLNEGTFYVQVLANYAAGARQARPFLNQPTSLDVLYANGMLTSTYGHPFMVYEPFALGIYNYAEIVRRTDEIKKSRIGENNVYWFLDSIADVDAKWQKILDAKPDLIKIGLLDAENYDKQRAAGDTVGKGLSPAVAASVVEKAHRAGLRVYAHIETANDFRLGLKIGVDGFAHAPYYGWNGKIEDAPKDDLTVPDLRLAAKKKAVVIPTAQIGRSSATDYAADGKQTLDRERFRRIVERQKRLLNSMRRSGVTVALGSDYYGRTLGEELWYLHDNRIFDNETLLKIAVEITPQTVFPNRKIGFLKSGYEASFIVLGSDPLADFAVVKNISFRFKQGFIISSPAPK